MVSRTVPAYGYYPRDRCQKSCSPPWQNLYRESILVIRKSNNSWLDSDFAEARSSSTTFFTLSRSFMINMISITNHLIHIDFIVILRHYRYPSDYLHVFSFFFTIFPFLVVILWCIYSSLISLLLLLLGSQNQLRKYTIAKSLICRASDPDWDLKISMPAYNPQCCDSHQENKLLLSFTVESTVLIVIIPLPSRNRNPTYNHLVDRVECW